MRYRVTGKAGTSASSYAGLVFDPGVHSPPSSSVTLVLAARGLSSYPISCKKLPMPDVKVSSSLIGSAGVTFKIKVLHLVNIV